MERQKPKTAQDALDCTMAEINDHLLNIHAWRERYGADEANWGHVATARHACRLLEKVLDAISGPIED